MAYVKKHAKQPPFPEIFGTLRPSFPISGNKLGSLHMIARIPLFEFEDDPVKRAEMEREFWESENKDYEIAKATYEKNVFVGTVFSGNTKASGVITKINVTKEPYYICHKASKQHIEEVRLMNIEKGVEYKPIKPGRHNLTLFLSAILNGTITIISTP